ncbi:hypothetical protein EON67_08165, partial [archaeon]
MDGVAQRHGEGPDDAIPAAVRLQAGARQAVQPPVASHGVRGCGDRRQPRCPRILAVRFRPPHNLASARSRAVSAHTHTHTHGACARANPVCRAKPALVELYSPFIRTYDVVVSTLKGFAARPAVARALDQIMTSDERVQGLSLETLFRAPLDRLLEYHELLTKLAQSCPAGDRSVAALNDSVETLAAMLADAKLHGYAGSSSLPIVGVTPSIS